MSLNAYQKAQNVTQSPREAEYRVFAKVTHALISASESGQRDSAFFEALDWNRRLWSVLSSDCAVEGNGLPKELRAQIISLGLWVSKFSTLVASGKEEMDALIDINRTIMEGLAVRPAAETDMAESGPPDGVPPNLNSSV